MKLIRIVVKSAPHADQAPYAAKGTEVRYEGSVEVGRTKDSPSPPAAARETNRIDTSDPTVSPRHCRIHLEGGALHVEDLNSDNGTWRLENGGSWTRIPPGAPAVLPSGSTLLLGKLQIEVYAEV